MKYIRGMNESRPSSGSFVSKLTKGEVDVMGFDKSKYDSVDDVTVTVIWDEDIDYGRGGIDGLGAVVHSVSASIDYRLADNDDETETVDYEFSREQVTTYCGNTLPFYPMAAELWVDNNKKQNECKLLFADEHIPA